MKLRLTLALLIIVIQVGAFAANSDSLALKCFQKELQTWKLDYENGSAIVDVRFVLNENNTIDIGKIVSSNQVFVNNVGLSKKIQPISEKSKQEQYQIQVIFLAIDGGTEIVSWKNSNTQSNFQEIFQHQKTKTNLNSVHTLPSMIVYTTSALK